MSSVNRWLAVPVAILVVLLIVESAVLPTEAQSLSAVETTLESLRGLCLEDFFEQSFRALMLRDPEGISYFGLADYYGVRNDRLTDISIAYTEKTMDLEAGIFEILKSYDRDALPERLRTCYDVYAWHLDAKVRDHPYKYHDYPLNGFLDFNVPGAIEFVFTTIHTLHDRDDVEDFLARLAQVPLKLDQLIEGIHHRAELGILTPKYILTSARRKIDSILGVAGGVIRDPTHIPVTRSPAYAAFASGLAKIDSLTQSEKDAYLERAETQFVEDYILAFWEVHELIDELLLTAPVEGGATTFPDGEGFFANELYRLTSTDLTPDNVHQLGLREVERIVGEMRDQFAAMGYPRDASLGRLWDLSSPEEDTYYNGQHGGGSCGAAWLS